MPQPTPRVSKYQPLADYLAAQSADEVTLSFAQIEALIGTALPPSAHARAWWKSSPVVYTHVRVWRQAGWEVTAFTSRDDDRWVTFRRRPADAPDNSPR